MQRNQSYFIFLLEINTRVLDGGMVAGHDRHHGLRYVLELHQAGRRPVIDTYIQN